MGNRQDAVSVFLDVEKLKEANADLVHMLQTTLHEGQQDLHRLRRKLAVTYGIIVVLSVAMFVAGILLLSVPYLAALRGSITDLNSLIAAGFGVADLVALLWLKPIEKLHNLMGDMSQIIVSIHAFQSQVALRLLEMDLYDRPTIGTAATKIGEAAQESIRTVQEYFETKEKP
jgi:hypothetical protein